jgi:Ca2+-binding EF-hand superfamily protein
MQCSIGPIAMPLLALAACYDHSSLRLDTREKVISSFSGVLKSWDRDGDGRLSRSEVEAMADEPIRELRHRSTPGETHPELEAQRQQMVAEYMSQDANGDGFLSLDELLRNPLAAFDCMDANHDGKVSKEEERGVLNRCTNANVSQPTLK